MFSRSSRSERRRPSICERLKRVGNRSSTPAANSRTQVLPGAEADTDPEINLLSLAQNANHSPLAVVLPSIQASGMLSLSAIVRNDQVRRKDDQSALHTSSLDQASVDQSKLSENAENNMVNSDLWSEAFREAVENLGKDYVAILEGRNVKQLFEQPEKDDKEAAQESAFIRGLETLRSIVPLEKFKLALDLATPLTSIEPAVATVFGVVRIVTAIAISLANTDTEFARQIGRMLAQLSYIDDCDTLGQQRDKRDIHQALVLIYQNILEFYFVANKILAKQGVRLVMGLIVHKDRLPEIIEDFLRHADLLQRSIQKATLEINLEIKSMLYDREIATWLGSDKMIQQSRYHAEMKDLRADQACEFLLTDTNFTEWYRATKSRQLAILGEMGGGKTVAMAFLVDQLNSRSEFQLPKPKVCYYCCRDDETGHVIHIFSALILALLEQLCGLKKDFLKWYQKNQNSGNLVPATDKRKLQEFLEMVLGSLDRPIFLVIDGLDECDRESRTSLLEMLRNVSHKNPRLKTLLSSRPEEEILEQLRGTAKINLVSDAKRDGVIVEYTVEKQLSHLSKDVQGLITDKLSRSAQGSHIWTKMTVELIKVREIKAFSPMQYLLEEMSLPGQLSKLYDTLLSRCTSDDQENVKLATTALKLLTVSRRPLRILELAWAATLAAAPQEVTTVAALTQLVDHQRVLELIYPFITRVDYGDLNKRQIGLVHKSVNEYIIENHVPDQALGGLAIEHLETCLLDVCVKYLLLDEIGYISIFSDEQLAIDELPAEADLFEENSEQVDVDLHCSWEEWEETMIRYDPTERGFGEFFVYASCHWITHFGAVAAGPRPSLSSIQNVCQAGSTRLHNWTQQNCRPDCVLRARFPFQSSCYDPLIITSLYGSEAMLLHMLRNSDFDEAKFLSGSVAEAADQILRYGDLARLKLLFLEGKHRHQVHGMSLFRLIIRQWSDHSIRHDDWDPAFDLIDHVVNAMIQEHWGNELLCVAAEAGCMPVVQRLMSKAQGDEKLSAELMREIQRPQKHRSFNRSAHQSIGEAILGNHVNVVECLLRQEGIDAHLHHLNSQKENVLHLASKHCNPEMFRLLAPRFIEGTQQTDKQGHTALVRVIMTASDSQDRYESARILLAQDVVRGTNQHLAELQSPLRMAVCLGDLSMCSLLLSVGKIDPTSALARDDDGSIVLKDMLVENKDNMPAILQLFSRHADTNAILND